MEFTRSKKPIRQVSMVPLINVVFLLLIFFLVAGTVKSVEIIDVELPEAVSGQLVDEGPVEILLGRYQEIIINDAPVVLGNVSTHMKRLLKDNPQRVITLKPDARMSASRMIEVMHRIKEGGGQNVSITTQQR